MIRLDEGAAMTLLGIGQLAKRTGVTVETIRFYEKRGLVAAPQRSDAGYRRYGPETVKRIRFIQRAKELGFTLSDIGELLALRQEPGSGCADIKLRATYKIEQVDQKMADLARIRAALARMILKCTGRGSLSECPILEELELDDE
jgi:MerR family mercuric resistance operon transcriptional regulator